MAAKKKENFLIYKGRPLVRSGDKLYYGNMADKFVVELSILTKKTVGDSEVADKVALSLMNTDPNVKPIDIIIKRSEKNGLYVAMDLAAVWLDRAVGLVGES